MRKALAVLFVSVALAVASASVAMADTVTVTGGPPIAGNDALHWGLLGVNNFFVASGSTLSTTNGIVTTITFGTGGTGATLSQCPASMCTWPGNFAPGSQLLSDFNLNTYPVSSGSIMLGFATGVSGVSFQLEPNLYNPSGPEPFMTQIGVYDGSTLLNTLFINSTAAVPVDGTANLASVYNVLDLTGADITAVRILAYNCSGVGISCEGFAISSPRIVDASTTSTPEPASLALLGSGLGILGFLRRKLAARK